MHFRKIFLLLLLSFLVTSTQASYWKNVTTKSSTPFPRLLHTTISYKNLTTNEDIIVIFGGFNYIDDTKSQTASAEAIRTNDVHRYSIQSGVWTTINTDSNLNESSWFLFPTSRALHSATYVPYDAPYYQHCMFNYGGDLDNPDVSPRMVALNLTTDTWIIKGNNTQWFYDPVSYVNSRRESVFHYSALDYSLVLFAGGGTNGFPLGSMHKFFLENETWVEIVPSDPSAAKPSNRARCVSSISNDGRYLYIYGGNAFSGIPVYQGSYSDLWKFDLILRTWTLLSPNLGQLPTPIESSQMFFINDQTLWLLPYDVPGYSSVFPLLSRDSGKWHAYQYRLDLNEWRSDPIRSEGSMDPKWSLWYRACLIRNDTSNDIYLALTGGYSYSGNTSVTVNDVRLLSFESGIPNIPITSAITIDSNRSSHNVTLIVAIVIPIAIVGILVVLITMLILRRRSNRRELIEEFGKGEDFKMKNILNECQIHDITIEERLGGGKFSDVYKGFWQKTTPVACKRLKEFEHLKSFEQEAMILKSLNHPNVVQFFGIYTDHNNYRYIVTEFMERGSLSQLFTTKDNFNVKDLLTMCRDTAAGMTYVTENHQIVHRDLALRNLLVTNREGRYVVKIADLGLARAINDEGHYLSQASQFPVKWTAPEAIQYRKFSEKSDVWSFGITAWEILSQGMEPYSGMSNSETVERISSGYRMPKPSHETPDTVYQLILDCWSFDPSSRPSFKVIHQRLLNAIKNIE